MDREAFWENFVLSRNFRDGSGEQREHWLGIAKRHGVRETVLVEAQKRVA